jgi:hypothetical protein
MDWLCIASLFLFKMHVTLVICAFAIRVFAYPRFYFCTLMSVNILFAATVETAVQVH